MATLTAEQASKLAHDFLVYSQAVGDYRISNWNKLNTAENHSLSSMQWSILNTSEDLYALSTDLVIDEVEPVLKTLGHLCDQMKQTLKVLSSVQKAIKIATAIVTLGAALVSKNPAGFKKALEFALTLVKID